jgi:molybdenum-dependent DNA-binding transcriptional regulator ModE
MDNLDKIDLIRKRLNVSYEKAFNALKDSNDDVVQALIKLEKESQRKVDFVHVKGEELIEKIKALVSEGNIKKILIKNNNKTLLKIPVTAGVVSVVLFPYITILAGLVALFMEFTLEIHSDE